MKQWNLTYELHSEFTSPVIRHSYSLRCLPRQLTSQQVLSCAWSVSPENAVCEGQDSFGNRLLTGCVRKPHRDFHVYVEAVVNTDGVPEPEPRPVYQLGMYRTPTPCTAAGEMLRQLAEQIGCRTCRQETASSDNAATAWERSKVTAWERAGQLQEALEKAFRYVSGSTCMDTTAEQALSQGCGVCQDYAHVLLALCRLEGLTVRYAAGAVPGEGQSHAWVEVWQDGFWKGFDPTNNRETDANYIRLALGRDAHDCRLNQGIFLGDAGQRQQVSVRMEERSFD